MQPQAVLDMGRVGGQFLEEQSNKWHVQIFCLSPPLLGQTPPGSQGRGNICMANTSFAKKKKVCWRGGCGEHSSGKDQPGLIAAAIRLTESRDLAHWRPNPA